MDTMFWTQSTLGGLPEHSILLVLPPLGCRCPPGQLVQDGHCVPISSCRCGLPSANASRELAPAEVVQLDCQNWYAALLACQGQARQGSRRPGAGQGF